MKVITMLFLSLICHSILHGQTPVEIVRATLWAEARGETIEGIHAVADVIVNRALARKTTPAQECLRQRQFSCWNNPKKEMIPESAKDERLHVIALAIVSDLWIPTTNFNHYYNASLCSPNWAKGKRGTVIGNHTFLKL